MGSAAAALKRRQQPREQYRCKDAVDAEVVEPDEVIAGSMAAAAAAAAVEEGMCQLRKRATVSCSCVRTWARGLAMRNCRRKVVLVLKQEWRKQY